MRGSPLFDLQLIDAHARRCLWLAASLAVASILTALFAAWHHHWLFCGSDVALALANCLLGAEQKEIMDRCACAYADLHGE